MGGANAERALKRELAQARPRWVISSGFAGGLAPELRAESVIFSCEDASLARACKQAGALPARFHCAQRVATTAGEKRALREQTGADAVEMESGIIGRVCAGPGVVHATVRVILDTANEDLPLDFNALMNAEQALASGKLALALGRRPWKVGALLQLQRRSEAAALALATVLARLAEADSRAVVPALAP
jgi:nucleoside phosphorylase